MTYDFSTRLDRLGTRMQELHQNSLVYERGDTTITISNVTPEKLDVTQLAAFGIVLITDRAQDFVFSTIELASLIPSEPQHGDKITWNDRVYEVFKLGEGEAGEVYRYTTSTRKRIRVHTRQIQ